MKNINVVSSLERYKKSHLSETIYFIRFRSFASSNFSFKTLVFKNKSNRPIFKPLFYKLSYRYQKHIFPFNRVSETKRVGQRPRRISISDSTRITEHLWRHKVTTANNWVSTLRWYSYVSPACTSFRMKTECFRNECCWERERFLCCLRQRKLCLATPQTLSA
jgi:hypothetical protein